MKEFVNDEVHENSEFEACGNFDTPNHLSPKIYAHVHLSKHTLVGNSQWGSKDLSTIAQIQPFKTRNPTEIGSKGGSGVPQIIVLPDFAARLRQQGEENKNNGMT